MAAASGPTVTISVDAGPGGLLAELDVEVALTRPELEHVAEHGHRAGAGRPLGGLGQVLEGGTHRHGVGVVAVIDQDHAAGQGHALTATRGELERHPPARRDPDRQRGGHGRQAGCGADAPGVNGTSSATERPHRSISTLVFVGAHKPDISLFPERDRL